MERMNSKAWLWIFIAVLCLGGAGAALYVLSSSKESSEADAPIIESVESPFSENYQKANALYDKAMDAVLRRDWAGAEANLKEIIEKYPDEMSGLETFSNMAAETLASLDCWKELKAKDFLSSFDVVSKAVLNALASKSVDRLMGLASCSFYVGRFETDHQVGVYPREAIPVIVELVSDLEWVEAEWSTPDFRVLEATKGEDVFFLTFAKDQGGWFWNGFVFDREDLFDNFKWSGRNFVKIDAHR